MFSQSSMAGVAGTLAILIVSLTACAHHRYDGSGMWVGDRHYPGQLVDVGGYQLFVNCTGEGSPTVVLDTGGGATSLTWLPVQDRLARRGFRVCSYDRPGLGWSETQRGEYDIERDAAALQIALAKLEIDDDLVLVGGSYGGFVMRLFAVRFPHSVAGLVYVDPNTVHFFDEFPDAVAETERDEPPWLAWVLPRWLIKSSQRGRFAKAAPNVAREDRDAMLDQMISKRHLRASVRKNRAFGKTVDRMREIQNPIDIPTVVVSRGLRDEREPWTSDEREQAWRDGHRTLLDGVIDGEMIIAERSRHVVMFDQPELVIDVVAGLAADARKAHLAAAQSRKDESGGRPKGRRTGVR